MSHTITERPHIFCLSKNEIRYNYTVSGPTRPGLYFEIKIMYRYEGLAVFKELVTEKLKPTSTGHVSFYMQQYIDSLLEPSQEFTAVINHAVSQYVHFYVMTREVWDDNTDEDFTEDEEDHVRVAFMAGVEKHRYSRNNFFKNYLFAGDVTRWLTWLPNNRSIFPGQPVYLTALIDPGTTDLAMKIKTEWMATDGSTGTREDAIDTEGYLFHINAEINSLGVIDPLIGKKLFWYEVSIVTSSETIVQPYRFYIKYEHFYQYHDLIYFNSLGGIDSIRIRGELTFAPERSFEQVEGGFGSSEWNTIFKQPETTHAALSWTRSYKGDVGYLNSQAEQEAILAELSLSPCILQLIDERFVRVLNISKSKDWNRSTDSTWSIPIEWQLAESNQVYTPSWPALALGNDEETYP